MPTTAEARIKMMGWSFLVCLTLLVSAQRTMARIHPFQLNTAREKPFSRAPAKNRLETTTDSPAAAISPEDAGRRP